MVDMGDDAEITNVSYVHLLHLQIVRQSAESAAMLCLKTLVFNLFRIREKIAVFNAKKRENCAAPTLPCPLPRSKIQKPPVSLPLHLASTCCLRDEKGPGPGLKSKISN